MNFVPHTDQDRAAMLAEMGFSRVEDLFSVIPPELWTKTWDLPAPLSEQEVGQRLSELANRNNTKLTSFLGAGFYDHFIPAAVGAILSRGEFYTAYTPYQAETSQGTLQTIFEYQTAICRLTGLDAANASLYDGGTALFEAAMMALRKTRRNRIVVCTSVNPIYRVMLKSYTAHMDLDLVETDVLGDSPEALPVDDKTACLILQNPDFFGRVHDLAPYFAKARDKKAVSIMSAYPLALAVLKTPAEAGADIAVGEGQSLGLPLCFGGPYLGYMAVKMEYIRAMPGRIVGRTKDHQGREGYCLTLQTREQHIRREKATSNICTNQALCALAALIYLTLQGPQGLKETAELNMAKAAYARERLTAIKGVKLIDTGPWFNEFRVSLPAPAEEVAARLLDQGFVAGYPLGRYYPDQKNNLLVAVTEKRTRAEIDQLAQALEASL